MNSSKSLRRIGAGLIVTLLVIFGMADLALAKGKGKKEQGIYSVIVGVEPKKGYILVTKDSNIVWVEASKAAKSHVRKLPVGEMIDIVVQMRGKKRAPLMTQWKLASGESKCGHFDGKRCR